MKEIKNEVKKEWATPSLNSSLIMDETKGAAPPPFTGSDGGSFPNMYAS